MLKNSRGQGLIEYLIIVAIVAIGSIAIVRSLGETIYVRFANITGALQHDSRATNAQPSAVSQDQIQKRNMNDFFKAAGSNPN